MFFIMTREKEERRKQLRNIVEEMKKNNLSIEEKKLLLIKNGFTDFNVTELSPSWHELREFLKLSPEEYKELGFVIWLS